MFNACRPVVRHCEHGHVVCVGDAECEEGHQVVQDEGQQVQGLIGQLISVVRLEFSLSKSSQISTLGKISFNPFHSAPEIKKWQKSDPGVS